MATYNKETGNIDLSQDDRDELGYINKNLINKKTPTADKIIAYILGSDAENNARHEYELESTRNYYYDHS